MKCLHRLQRWNEPWRGFLWSWAEGTGLPALLPSSHWIVSKPLLLSLGIGILSIFCRRKLMDFYSRSSWENEMRQHGVCCSYFSHGFNWYPTRRKREKGGFNIAHSSRSEAAKPQGPPILIHFPQQGSASKRFPNLPKQHHQLGTSSDASALFGAFLIQTKTEFGRRHVQEGVATYICSHCAYVSNLYLCTLYTGWECSGDVIITSATSQAGNCSHRVLLKYLLVTPVLVCLLLLR